jgi:hypothetical protein
LGAARSLSRVDACNPLLQAHPTWARDEHEGRGISHLSHASLRPPRSPPFALALALDPPGLGHAATFTRRPRDPPISKRRQLPSKPKQPKHILGLLLQLYTDKT